jgi:hypothetical protein
LEPLVCALIGVITGKLDFVAHSYASVRYLPDYTTVLDFWYCKDILWKIINYSGASTKKGEADLGQYRWHDQLRFALQVVASLPKTSVMGQPMIYEEILCALLKF